MALSYLEMYNLISSDGDLWRKAAIACFKAAVDVINEDPGTSNHANRVIWANQVFTDPIVKAKEMKYGILQNATVQTLGNSTTDNDIQFVVNGLINSYAKG